MATNAHTLQQRRGPGIQGRRRVDARLGLVFDEAFVDHRQPAQRLPGSHRRLICRTHRHCTMAPHAGADAITLMA